VFFTPRRRQSAHRLLDNRGRDERTRREHATALYVTGIIQAALAVALLVAGLAAFRAVQAHARDVQGTLRFGLPGLFVAGALVTVRSAVRNLRMARLERSPSNHDAPGTT
jgi:hypothetical protein